MDNGPEFVALVGLVALALRGLCCRYGISAAYIELGKPWQNGFAESFHARLRDAFLGSEVFVSTIDAQVLMLRLGYKEKHVQQAGGKTKAKSGI